MADDRAPDAGPEGDELAADAAPDVPREPVELAGVSLAVAVEGGERRIEGLSLTLDDAGIGVTKPDGQPAARIPWPELKTLRVEPTEQSGACGLTAVSAAGTHRFLIPGQPPDQFRRLAGAWFPLEPVPARRAVSPWLLTLLLLVVAAGVVVAVLAGLGKL